MSVLRFDCRFRYPTGFALDLAFDAGAGVTALVGPSGSGKTTALNLIAGLLTPRSGTITLGEKQLFNSAAALNLPPEDRAIGYVFQDYQLFPHLSVLDNLKYGRCRTRRETVALEKVVDTLELADHLRQPPATLSGGQKQRVALGRALLRSPELLLLDEPLSALDLELRRSVEHYLGRVIDEFHIPSILVSHDQASVAALAGEIVNLASAR